MRKAIVILLALCLLLLPACNREEGEATSGGDVPSSDGAPAGEPSEAERTEPSPPESPSAAESSAAAPPEQSVSPEPETPPAESSEPEEEESSTEGDPGESEGQEEYSAPNAPTHEEKEQPGRDSKRPGGEALSLEVIHTDIDPQDNSFIVTLDDAYEIVAMNIRNIEFIPERYGVAIERVDEIQGENYYHVWIYNALNYNTVGFFYVDSKTGAFYRHDYQSTTGRLVPIG